MDIYIHNRKIDLFPGTIIAISYQNSLIGELKSLRVNSSNRIKIPRTAHNSHVLGLLSVKANTSDKPYEKIPCSILNGSVAMCGLCIVTKSAPGYFEIVVYSGAVDFFEKLRGKTLKDLDLAEYSHVLSPQNLFASFGNKDGYIYAFAKFINNRSEGMDCQYWMPSVFEHTLFQKMMDMTGYAIRGAEEMNHNVVVAPANGVERNRLETFDVYNKSSYGSVNYVIPPDRVDDETIYARNLSQQGGLYTITITGKDRSRLRDNGQDDRLYVEVLVKHREYQGGNIIEFIRTGDTAFSHTTMVQFNKTYTFYSTPSHNILDYDYIHLVYRMKLRRWQGQATAGTAVRDYDIEIKIERLNISQEIHLSNILPALSLLDFLKEIMVRNGYVMKVKGDKTCQLKKLDYIIRDTANAIDWSGKLVEIKSETYKLGKYYKCNKADYADNSQVLLFNLQNEKLEDSGSVLKSIYGNPDKNIISYELTYLNFIEIVEHVIYSTDSEGSKFPKNLKSEKATPKIFSLDGVHRKLDMRSYGIDSTRRIYEGIVPHLSPEEVRINEEFNRNCSAHKNIVDKPLVVRASFFIKQLDISKLDFFRLVYLKQYSKYFVLNRIINYKGEGVTECELVAVKPYFGVHDYGYGYGYGNAKNSIVGDL